MQPQSQGQRKELRVLFNFSGLTFKTETILCLYSMLRGCDLRLLFHMNNYRFLLSPYTYLLANANRNIFIGERSVYFKTCATKSIVNHEHGE